MLELIKKYCHVGNIFQEHNYVDLDFFSIWCAEPHLRILQSLFEVLTQKTKSHNE